MKSFPLLMFSGLAAIATAQTPGAAPQPVKPAAPAASPAVKPPTTPTATPPMATTPMAAVPAAVPTDPSLVILTIGTEKITLGEYNRLIDALPAQFQTAARGPQKRQIAERLVQLRVMAREAEKRNLDKTPAVQEQLAFQRENILANAMFQDFTKNAKVDDAAVRKYYDDHKAEYESAKGRHILVRFKGSAVPQRPGTKELSEEEALAKATDLKKKLDGGADFGELAKTDSDDTGSGTNGGDLGTFKHGQMVPAFEQAAFGLPVGKVSDPIKTQFGYHLIKLESKDAKSFEQAKPEIAEKLGPEVAKKQVDDLRAGTPVKFDDAFFGPATPQ